MLFPECSEIKNSPFLIKLVLIFNGPVFVNTRRIVRRQPTLPEVPNVGDGLIKSRISWFEPSFRYVFKSSKLPNRHYSFSQKIDFYRFKYKVKRPAWQAQKTKQFR